MLGGAGERIVRRASHKASEPRLGGFEVSAGGGKIRLTDGTRGLSVLAARLSDPRLGLGDLLGGRPSQERLKIRLGLAQISLSLFHLKLESGGVNAGQRLVGQQRIAGLDQHDGDGATGGKA